MPALRPGQSHSDRATVTAVGVHSGTETGDEDDWHGFTEPVAVTPDKGFLATTGASLPLWIGAAALALLLAGGATLLIRRSRTSAENGVTTE